MFAKSTGLFVFESISFPVIAAEFVVVSDVCARAVENKHPVITGITKCLNIFNIIIDVAKVIRIALLPAGLFKPESNYFMTEQSNTVPGNWNYRF